MEFTYDQALKTQVSMLLGEIKEQSSASILRNLPKYFQTVFGSHSQSGWIHNVHRQLIHHQQHSETFKYFLEIVELFGPEGKLGRVIFSRECTGYATLESQQLPKSILKIFDEIEVDTSEKLLKYEAVFEKNRGLFNFRTHTLNLTLQQWYLFVLVDSAINSTYISIPVPLTLDDFYHNIITNPYLTIILKYLVYFKEMNSLNYQKLLFILKEYTIVDYNLNANSRSRSYIIPKQIVLYIIYILIFFEREGLSRQEMTDFFRYYMSSKNRGIQAFESSSLSRLWLYYIRPFDHSEASVMNLVLRVTSIREFKERTKYSELKRYNPESVLSAPEFNQLYHNMIINNSLLYGETLNLSIISMFGRGQMNYKSIYILTIIAVLYSPNYQSSICYIQRTQSAKPFALSKTADYFEAKITLQKVKTQLNEMVEYQQNNKTQEKKQIRSLYLQFREAFQELYYLYEIDVERVQKFRSPRYQKFEKKSLTKSTAASQIQEKQQVLVMDKKSQWQHNISSHELRIFYYLFLLIANIIDLVIYTKPFSWKPITNLRPLCSISTLLLITIITILFYALITYL